MDWFSTWYQSSGLVEVSSSTLFVTNKLDILIAGSSRLVRSRQEKALQIGWFSETFTRSRSSCSPKRTPSAPINGPSTLLRTAETPKRLVLLLPRGWPQACPQFLADQQWSSQCCNVSARQLCLIETRESWAEAGASATAHETKWSREGSCLHEKAHGEV